MNVIDPNHKASKAGPQGTDSGNGVSGQPVQDIRIEDAIQDARDRQEINDVGNTEIVNQGETTKVEPSLTTSDMLAMIRMFNPQAAGKSPIQSFEEDNRPHIKAVRECARALFEKEKGRIPPSDILQIYGKLCTTRYKKIRIAEVPYPPLDENSLNIATSSNREEIKCSTDREDGMSYRFPNNVDPSAFETGKRVNEVKYSMNLNVCEGLIKVLDDFILRNPAAYKVDIKHYTSRHDSVNLYPIKELTWEQERELAEIIQPYIRNDSLIGDTISGSDGRIFQGIRKEIEPKEVEVVALIERCKDLDTKFSEAVWVIASDYGSSETLLLSRAQLIAIESLYNDLKTLLVLREEKI